MIIDFRVRPPYGSFKTLSIFTARLAAENRPAAWVGPLAPSVKERSFEMFREELHEAGVARAVVWGRAVQNQAASTKNEEVAELCARHPDTFFGFAGIAIPRDAEETASAVRELERGLLEHKLQGVTLEPGFAMTPTDGADDPRFYPIYERCRDLGGVLALTISVRAGTDIRYSNPEAVDRVAAAFPKLKIVVGHSFWPWVAQACGVAYRRRNVFLLPDFYGLGCPGHLQWVEAANTLLEDQIVFGSAYPLAAVKSMVEGYRRLPFRSGVLEKVMWKNAAGIVGLEG